MSPITTEQWGHVFGMLADAYSDSGGLKGAWAWLQAQGHTLGFSTFKAHLRIERETRRIAGVKASEALTATDAVPMLDAVPLQIDAALPLPANSYSAAASVPVEPASNAVAVPAAASNAAPALAPTAVHGAAKRTADVAFTPVPAQDFADAAGAVGTAAEAQAGLAQSNVAVRAIARELRAGSGATDVCGRCDRKLADTVTVVQICAGLGGGEEVFVRSCNLCIGTVELPTGMSVVRTEHHRPENSDAETSMLALVVAPTGRDALADSLAAAGAAYMELVATYKHVAAGGDLNGNRYLVLVECERDEATGKYPRPPGYFPAFAREITNPSPAPPTPKDGLAVTYTRPPAKAASKAARGKIRPSEQAAFIGRVSALCDAIADAAQQVIERDTKNGKLQFLLDEMTRARGLPRVFDARKVRRVFIKAGESILSEPDAEAQTNHKDELAKRMIQAPYVLCLHMRECTAAPELRAGLAGPVLRHLVRAGDAAGAERTSRRDAGHVGTVWYAPCRRTVARVQASTRAPRAACGHSGRRARP